MKNQYFGDVRDLFKYDLIQEIMQQSLELRQFSFIPMLTENDDKKDGNNRIIDERTEKGHRPGTQNSELVQYLRKYDEIPRDQKDFTEILGYFKKQGMPTIIYGSDGCHQDRYFTQGNRREYFSDIPGHTLKSALVYVDPDNGLEVKKPSGKHLRYSEVRTLFERMSDDSLLMIYQHFPRENHAKYINRRVEKLRDVTKKNPLWISDNEIIFFFVAKNDQTHNDLENVLSDYSGRYENYCLNTV